MNPTLREPEFFSHKQQACLPFVLEGGLILTVLDCNQNCPLFQRETLSLSSKAIHYTNTLEMKQSSAEIRETHKKLFSNNIHLLFLHHPSFW